MTKPQDSWDAGQARCHALGDLAARAAEEQPADFRQWDEIEQALAGRFGVLRRRWWLLAAPALAGLALWIAAGRSLEWQGQGCALVPDGGVSAPAGRACVVTFSDGTRITLEQNSLARVRGLGFWRGAQIALERGRAALAVVHRPACRWEVLTGPLQARVIGTRFVVGWAPGPGRFSLGVSDGEVRVSGAPLRSPTPVRAGQRLDVNTATGSVVMGELVAPARAPVMAQTKQAAPVESAEKAAPAAAPVPASHAEHAKGASTGKTATQSSQPAPREATPAAAPEIPTAIPELGPDAWAATEAADDAPVAPKVPASFRLTVGNTGELIGGPTGPVWVGRGSGTRFTGPASAPPTHLYFDDGALCTRGRIAALTCVDAPFYSRRCDGDINWGVLIKWYPRAERDAWGSLANSRMTIEFRGESGRYRLFAHRVGDSAKRAYCVSQYRSGQAVSPSDFRLDCWTAGPTLPDFTHIDYFALQIPSEDDWITFKFCLSAISLH